MENKHHAAGHERTLALLFEHPMSHNIEWKDVVRLLQTIGVVREGGHDTTHATVNGHTVMLHHTHEKTLTGDQVMQLRHFLRGAGIELPTGATGDKGGK